MNIVRRGEWNARPPKSRIPIGAVSRLWLHHTAGAHPSREHFEREGKPKVSARLFKASAIKHVQGIQNFHMDGRGWADIAYSYIVFKAWFGRRWVFEGRGAGVQGAHTEGDNSGSLAISLVGNYEVEGLDKKTVGVVQKLFDSLRSGADIVGPRGSFPTGGHRNAPGAQTLCPGNKAMRWIGTMRKPFKRAARWKVVGTKRESKTKTGWKDTKAYIDRLRKRGFRIKKKKL